MITITLPAEPAANAGMPKARRPGLFERIDFASDADPTKGIVRWSPIKSLWWTGMTIGWLTLGTVHFSLSALVIFVALSSLTLCLGHSLGMHRKLIHQSFECPKPLERALVYLGTLVGLGGPFTMMYTHDIRDWAQRSATCHDFLSHKRRMLNDFWWQLHCKLHLDRGPDFTFPPNLRKDAFYQALQATSMLQQVPLALLLYVLGGWGWVAWGVCARVSVSIFGHWLVGYIAHNGGERDWHIEGASTQGFNLRRLGLITFGECWHNNHHAFPGSAKLGLSEGQLDPGWLVLQGFERLGLIWNAQTPKTLPPRDELRAIGQ
ncbi:MAG: acyl-CoA desaturase [Pseudomonadota bacterium]